MNLKLTSLLTLGLLLTIGTNAQLSSTMTVQDNLCNGDSTGSVTLSGIEACFAPIMVAFDTFAPFAVPTLKNEGYKTLNHGSGTGTQGVLGVTSASTSIGDVYIAAGYFEDSITFDTTTLYDNGAQAMFVACFETATGDLLWADAASAGGATYVLAYGATIVGDKAFVVGYLEGTTVFGSTSVVSAGGYQGFIAKYDIPTGGLDSVLQVGNAGDEECTNIHAGADNRLYVTGDFTGSINLAGNTYSSAGSYDAFVTCFDTTLTQNYWAAKGGGTGIDVCADATTFSNAGVVEYTYVTAYFHGNATFGSSAVSSAGGRDFLVAKIDTLGNWIWAKSGGASGNNENDNAYSIDINSSGDRLYVGGTWQNTMTYDAQPFVSQGNVDGFIMYLDTAGSLDDLYQFGGTGPEAIYDLQSIDDDYLVFVGQRSNTWTFADSNFTSNGGTDAFTGKIGPNQHEIWGKNFGGTSSAVEYFNSISAGPGSNLHCGGVFSGNASFYQSGLIATGVDAIVTNETFFGTWDTTITLSGLAAGDYYVVLTDSNGNVAADTATVSEPDAIVITGTVTNASTSSSNDGAIDITVAGGTPGYTYNWSNSAITEDLSGLSYGNYTVTVTDSNGCFDTATFVVDTGATVFNVNAAVTDVTCGGDSNGIINLTVSGGTSPYTFSWSTGATSEDLIGLSGGTYSVTVTDSDSGSFSGTFTVNEAPALTLSEIITPPSSGAATDGAIDITVGGGTPGYTYSWSNSETTEDLDSLSIGTYSVTVTDSAGCTISKTFFVDAIAALSLVFASTDVTCENTLNGTIDMTIVGGLSPFAIAWSNGNTTEDLSALAPGTYSVTVTDNASQVASDVITIGSNPIYPDPIVGPITGATSAQAWMVFSYSVPSTSGSSFTWSAVNGTITGAASNASSILWNAGPNGKVYVQETDANGCSAYDSLAINILFVGVKETHENSILIYPNPTEGLLNINLLGSFQGPMMQIFDLSGQVVLTQRLGAINNRLDVSALTTGIYLITLSTETGTVTDRIVVR